MFSIFRISFERTSYGTTVYQHNTASMDVEDAVASLFFSSISQLLGLSIKNCHLIGEGIPIVEVMCKHADHKV